MRKKRVLGFICTFASVGMICSCSSFVDKDKNGLDDRVESQGIYCISVAGSESSRNEYINVQKVENEKEAYLSGSIYSQTANKTYYFNYQRVDVSEYQGNVWYCWVKYTDNASRRVYFMRSGIGSYIASGSFSLGAAGATIGAGWTYTVYDEYGRVLYCVYDNLSYTK